MNNEITTKPQYVFNNADSFETAQRMAKALSESSLIPKEYKKNIPNTLVALEMANRTGASIFMVMQNLYIVHGRPSWSSQFIIAAINTCGRFNPLQFKITKDEEETELTYNQQKRKFINITCVAHTTDKDGVLYESPPISIAMAILEGWHDRNGSKWQTLPELMLRYRAASFFGRLYAPEILMGMPTEEESKDREPIKDITPLSADSAEITKRFDTPGKILRETPEGIIREVAHPESVAIDSSETITRDPINHMPDRTKDDLEAKAKELIRLIDEGGDKIELMQAFGGLEFSEKLKTAGLEQYNQNIREM